ncbi:MULTISPECIES: pantothenate kinase [unclassified Moraxella]|uniref:pantothenate kinase n=1 Tax=unclassified Moraxella TaxID=2685852 RepID=UPI003AF5693B
MTKLWLDLGNTRLKYWLTDNTGTVLDQSAEQHLQAPAELLKGLTFRFERLNPDFIGVSSVLGQAVNHQVAESLTRLNTPFEFAQVSARHPVMSSDYNPSQLGVDRWLQMLGAVDKDQQLCVVGCGTALTIDLIDKGKHLGGYIFPSIYLQREALFSGTRQISIIEGTFDSIQAGTTTQDAVHRGILLSIVGAINEVLKQHPNFTLVMTGGDAPIFEPYLITKPMIKQDLLLVGLQRFFDR